MMDEAAALDALAALCASSQDDLSIAPGRLLEALLAHRTAFGITRVGSVTRLDRLRLPVVQAVRPLALSNAVSQGKGLTMQDAALSAMLEGVETWAAERAPARACPPRRPDPAERAAWASTWPPGEPAPPVPWMAGVDLLTGGRACAPLALVDTVYTLPSPHPPWFARTTTGLGAGPTLRHAAAHAALELVEREALWRARRKPHFFERHQVGLAAVAEPWAGLLARLAQAGLVAGAWRVPAPLPVYWCHVMEDGQGDELAPLPAEGFGCDLTEAGAFGRALLEACQARLTAITAAREDLSSDRYAPGPDRDQLARWRVALASGGPPMPADAGGGEGDRLAAGLRALGAMGATRVVAVPLAFDPALPLAVARLVAPPLHVDPREGLQHG